MFACLILQRTKRKNAAYQISNFLHSDSDGAQNKIPLPIDNARLHRMVTATTQMAKVGFSSAPETRGCSCEKMIHDLCVFLLARAASRRERCKAKTREKISSIQ